MPERPLVRDPANPFNNVGRVAGWSLVAELAQNYVYYDEEEFACILVTAIIATFFARSYEAYAPPHFKWILLISTVAVELIRKCIGCQSKDCKWIIINALLSGVIADLEFSSNLRSKVLVLLTGDGIGGFLYELHVILCFICIWHIRSVIGILLVLILVLLVTNVAFHVVDHHFFH